MQVSIDSINVCSKSAVSLQKERGGWDGKRGRDVTDKYCLSSAYQLGEQSVNRSLGYPTQKLLLGVNAGGADAVLRGKYHPLLTVRINLVLV